MSVVRLLVTWVVLAVLMSANGILRELLLKRLLHPGTADLLSAFLGVLIILLVSRVAFRGLASASGRQIARVTVAFVGLTVAFEFIFGHFVDGISWRDLAANYAFWRGRLWPVVLLVLAITPVLWGRWAVPHRARARGVIA